MYKQALISFLHNTFCKLAEIIWTDKFSGIVLSCITSSCLLVQSFFKMICTMSCHTVRGRPSLNFECLLVDYCLFLAVMCKAILASLQSLRVWQVTFVSSEPFVSWLITMSWTCLVLSLFCPLDLMLSLLIGLLTLPAFFTSFFDCILSEIYWYFTWNNLTLPLSQ